MLHFKKKNLKYNTDYKDGTLITEQERYTHVSTLFAVFGKSSAHNEKLIYIVF